ncbi:MAG: sodium:solute symporter family protein [Acidobacteria bacterium]|nr:sodium:solute symporter family protein [Acidobacteriota bacterium]
MILGAIIGYLILVASIGLVANRLLRGTGEDYFVASRSIGAFVLLMSLFGTHMTAFAILGASGEAYHSGVGVFALMASSSAFVVPVVFFVVGTRIWRIGKEQGFLTQVQFFRHRYGDDRFGLALFLVLVALMIPYLLIGVMGAGITLSEITEQQVPQWMGGLLVCVVIAIYVCSGGLRGTAWVNTFQTLVFGLIGVATFWVVSQRMGGLESAMQKVAGVSPDLLIRGEKLSWVKVISYTFVPLSVGMFPHMFMHWLTAKSGKAFKSTVIFYPVCIAVVWIPSVLLGVLGVVDFPGLQGPAANSVLVRMVSLHAPGLLGGLLAAGVFAAIMSSLDSQSLSLGTMFTHDVVRHYGLHDKMSEKQQVMVGRAFVLLVLTVTYLLSLVVQRSIFKLGIWSFTGFAALIPLVIAALYWKRSSRVGAWLCLLTVVVGWVYFYIQAGKIPGYTVFGLMPVVVLTVTSSLSMVLGSFFFPNAQSDH